MAKKRSIGIENNTTRAAAAKQAYTAAVKKGLLSDEEQARITLKEVLIKSCGSRPAEVPAACGGLLMQYR